MAGFVPKDKLSKKARKELNRQRRKTWEFSPVTRTVDSRKVYNRRKHSHDRYEDYGMGVFQFAAMVSLLKNRTAGVQMTQHTLSRSVISRRTSEYAPMVSNCAARFFSALRVFFFGWWSWRIVMPVCWNC